MEYTKEDFYNYNTGTFLVTPNSQIAHVLGENILTPKETFKNVENIYETRIDGLNEKGFDVNHISREQVKQNNELKDTVDSDFNFVKSDGVYRARSLKENFEKNNQMYNNESDELKKDLDELYQDKVRLLLEINKCMNRLKQIENIGGVDIENTKMKNTMDMFGKPNIKEKNIDNVSDDQYYE